MKKILLPLVALALIVVACNKNYKGTEKGYGSLRISAITDRSVISIQTRAANLNPETYFLTLQSDKDIAYDGVFPVGGTLSNLSAGTYTGRLKSEATEFTVPAFDSPFYAATVNNIVITSGGTSSVEFVCKQSNAGVKFVYDTSLEAAGYGNIVPIVTQSGYSLSYSGSDRAATGYFATGAATLKLLDDETPVPISGSSTEIPLTFAVKELWTITLKAVIPSEEEGKAAITVIVDTEDIIARTLEITIGSTDVPIDPSLIMFRENFENCTGSNYPIEGATFSTAGTGYPSLTSDQAIANAGLTGWTFVNGYTCKNGLKMGIANPSHGTATTPPLTEIGETPKTVVLTFMAANWETSSRGLKVDIIGDGSVISPIGGTITLPAGTANGEVISAASAMQQYTVVINGATKDTRIVFSPASTSGSNSNRYFLADITVFLEE